MREDRKILNALELALQRIQNRNASQVSTSDLQLVLLDRIDTRLRQLIQLKNKDKQAEPDTSAPSEVSEPRPVKKKRRSFFKFLFH